MELDPVEAFVGEQNAIFEMARKAYLKANSHEERVQYLAMMHNASVTKAQGLGIMIPEFAMDDGG